MQLFLGNPKHPKQLIINTLRDGVKTISGHLEVSGLWKTSFSVHRCIIGTFKLHTRHICEVLPCTMNTFKLHPMVEHMTTVPIVD